MALLTPDQVTQIASNVGFPPALANGIAGQESGYGSTSPNVAQITPSTAADPGYGMAPLSPTDMADPSKNLAFALDLARRKVMAMGKDPNDPANAPLLAQAQNGFGSGAGDPAYYQHVMNRMGYQGALGGTAGPSSFGNLPNPTNGPFQGQPLPAMPAGFGTPSQPPVQAPQVQQPGGASNPLVALGLGLAGGNGWHDGIAKGGAAYQDALALQQKTGADNAQLQEQTNDLNAAAPDRAAQAASLRADAWKALNPVVTPDQAATLNLQARGQDVQAQDAQAQLAATAAYRQFLTGQTKTANTYVDRGADGTASPTFYTQTIGRDGQVHVTDANGNPATLPATATTQAEDQRPDPVTVANVRANTKAISDFGTANQAALDQACSWAKPAPRWCRPPKSCRITTWPARRSASWGRRSGPIRRASSAAWMAPGTRRWILPAARASSPRSRASMAPRHRPSPTTPSMPPPSPACSPGRTISPPRP